MHTQRYGYCSETEQAEIVSVRASVTGALAKPELPQLASGGATPPADASSGSRPVYFSSRGGWVDAPTWRRDRLLAGNRVTGPALIEEYASTTVLAPGDRMEVDRFGNLVIEIDHD